MWHAWWMAVAALVFSILAIIVAGSSAWYSRRQFQEAKRSADIEADRRADELEARQRADLDAKRARLALHVRRERNDDGGLDEGPYRHDLVVSNQGNADARDVQLTIVSAWNNPLGTRACFVDGSEQRIRVGRVLTDHPTAKALCDDPTVDYGDIGVCEVEWRDDSSSGLQSTRLPARPNWTPSEA